MVLGSGFTQNLYICFRAVAPLAIYFIIGIIARHKGFIGEEDTHKLNRFVFNIFFPVFMFRNIYNAGIDEILYPGLLGFAAVSVLAEVMIISFIIVRITEEPRRRGAMIQAIYRSNFVMMGTLIVGNIFGDEGLPVVTMLIAVIVPFFNVIAIILLEHFRGGQVSAGQAVRKIMTNPLILGAACGIAALLADIRLPEIVTGVMEDMSAATAPIALIILGASFNMKSARMDRRYIVICVAGRLVIVPAIAVTVSILTGFRGAALVSLLVMFASPTAISSYTMAEGMDSDAELAGNAIIFSTPLSCLTLFLWLLLLKTLGLF